EKARYQSRLALHYITERPIAFLKFYAFGVFTSFANLGTRGFADMLGLRDVDEDRFDLRAHPNVFDLLRAAIAHKTAGELWIGAVTGGSLLVFYACLAAGLRAARAMPAGRGRCFLLLCGVLAAYYVALTGAAGLARFRLAAMPYLVVVAGVGAADLWARSRARWRWPQGAARAPSWQSTPS
ncbi:MAG TPA: hypothetical protein VMS55_05620, partial [Myxococcota bacterium]|nr:hypothetical protein [Myxococcota bacterium]